MELLGSPFLLWAMKYYHSMHRHGLSFGQRERLLCRTFTGDCSWKRHLGGVGKVGWGRGRTWTMTELQQRLQSVLWRALTASRSSSVRRDSTSKAARLSLDAPFPCWLLMDVGHSEEGTDLGWGSALESTLTVPEGIISHQQSWVMGKWVPQSCREIWVAHNGTHCNTGLTLIIALSSCWTYSAWTTMSFSFGKPSSVCSL